MHLNLMRLLAERASSAEGSAEAVLAAAALLNAVPLANLLTEGSVDTA